MVDLATSSERVTHTERDSLVSLVLFFVFLAALSVTGSLFGFFALFHLLTPPQPAMSAVTTTVLVTCSIRRVQAANGSIGGSSDL